jgi:hypothetical protein
MTLRRNLRAQVAVGALGLLGLICLGLILTRSHPSGQTSVLGQLEKPATTPVTTVGPGPVNTTMTLAGYSVGVRITSNLVSRSQVVRLDLTRAGRPVDGARVTLSYSMPSMNMPSVLTRTLTGAGSGAYHSSPGSALEMSGDWLLSFRIVPMHGRPLAVALADRLPH